jgi:hypothetical protein
MGCGSKDELVAPPNTSSAHDSRPLDDEVRLMTDTADDEGMNLSRALSSTKNKGQTVLL